MQNMNPTRTTDLSSEEAARQLKLSARTVRRMIKRKTLKGYKTDPGARGVYKIPQSEIDRILQERAQ